MTEYDNEQESPEQYVAVVPSRYNDYVIAVDEGGQIVRSACGRGLRRFHYHYQASDHLYQLATKRRETLKRRINQHWRKR